MTKYRDTLTGFMVVVLAISLINIVTGLDNINYIRIIHSAIGLLAGFLFFTGRKFYKLMTFIWLFSQVPVLTRNFFDKESGIFFTQKIWDLTLNYSFSLGFHINAMKIDADVVSLILLIIFVNILKQIAKAEKDIAVEVASGN